MFENIFKYFSGMTFGDKSSMPIPNQPSLLQKTCTYEKMKR